MLADFLQLTEIPFLSLFLYYFRSLFYLMLKDVISVYTVSFIYFLFEFFFSPTNILWAFFWRLALGKRRYYLVTTHGAFAADAISSFIDYCEINKRTRIGRNFKAKMAWNDKKMASWNLHPYYIIAVSVCMYVYV